MNVLTTDLSSACVCYCRSSGINFWNTHLCHSLLHCCVSWYGWCS